MDANGSREGRPGAGEKGPTLLELARQALSSTERGYDLLAPKFDATPFRTPDLLLEAVRPHLGPPGSFRRALDVCCGTGAAMRMLRPLASEEVVGVDLSRGMLAEAERRLEGAPGEARLRFVRADALDLPFEAEFDVVTCFGAFGHIERRDEARFVRGIARALRPGGRFVFATSRMPPRASRRYLLSRAFNAAMRVRNALWSPPFVMYYLTFLLPEAKRLLEEAGLEVEVRDALAPPSDLSLVLATRPGSPAE